MVMNAELKFMIYWHITESGVKCCGLGIISRAIVPIDKCIRSRLGGKMSEIKYFICISNDFLMIDGEQGGSHLSILPYSFFFWNTHYD